MKNRYLCLILFLLLQMIAVRWINYDYKFEDNDGLAAISKIPKNINNWKGTDYPLAQAIYDILETRSVIHRSYLNDEGKKVFLSVVYYNKTKVDFHAPESCLGGQGSKTTKSPAEVQLIGAKEMQQVLAVNQLIQAGEQGDNNLVYYFYKAGPFIGRNYFKLRLNLVLNKFTDTRKSGSLIRISTPMRRTPYHAQESALLEQFVNQLYPYIINYL